MGKLLRFLVLACVVQAAGAQALFKGFVPDENGMNLDAPQVNRTIQQKVSPGTIIKDCPECPDMTVIPTGSFVMGSSSQEQALATAAGLPQQTMVWESPQHEVSVTGFAAGLYAVTKGEFAAFARASGYHTEAEETDGCAIWTGKEWKKESSNSWRNVTFTQGDDHPVVCVTWNDAQAYIQWLNKTSGKRYRLPSEAEREYSARAGTQTEFWWGNSITTLRTNYNGSHTYNGSPKGQYRQATVPVYSFTANPWGLYNMNGNVTEWTQDCWHETYAGAPLDGSAWTTNCSGDRKVVRGGSWYLGPVFSRAAFRSWRVTKNANSSTGFRLARDL
jgi:formylglycine-generating enzyme required for sulfatase activity